MFSLFLKKKNCIVSDDKEADAETKDGSEERLDNQLSQIGAGYASANTAEGAVREAAKKFAKPDTYTRNRKLFDSGAAKNNAKKKLFETNVDVYDPYTGEKLLLTREEAKLLYGKDYTKHLAESDHVKPLEKIYNDTKNNVWVTTDDIKSAANSDDNIRVASRKFNNPKRSRTNEEYVEDTEYLKEKGVKLTKQGKILAKEDGKLAEKSINKQLGKSAVRNIAQTGHQAGLSGAKTAGVTALTMSGIMNMVSVIKGEKSADEALLEAAKTAGEAAVTGYVTTGSITVVSHSLSNSSSAFIKGLAESNVPGKVITAVMVTGETLLKWSKGEISNEDCIFELGEKGVNLAATGYSMAVGQALIPIPVVGAAVGALVGSMLTSALYSSMIGQLRVKKYEHEERIRIIQECNTIAAQTKAFRIELEEYLEAYFEDCRSCFNEAITSMNFAFEAGDADGVIEGANKITQKLNGQVYFNNTEEFKSFLDSDIVDVF